MTAASARQQLTVRAAATVAEGQLQTPHGGKLMDLMAPQDQHASLKSSASRTVELSDRNACDVELLVVGAFSPLPGFMDEATYDHVVEHSRLPADAGLEHERILFGLPVVLDTDDDSIATGDTLLLQYQGQDLAVMTVSSKWAPNKPKEAKHCYGTTSIEHPGVSMISMERGKYYLGGDIKGLALPKRVFPCATPAEVRSTLPAGKDVLAFQCRNPIHRAHYELFTRALSADNVREGAVCLVHPTCGPTQDDDIPGVVRYRTYEVLKEEVANPQLRWAYLPYSMHMAGPREAIQHMIMRRNYGATHFIIGRDMAGSKSSLSGEDFYGPYDAQEHANRHAAELNMQTVPSLNITYTEEKGYVTADVADAEGLHRLNLSGTKFRQLLRSNSEIPEWFAFSSVVRVLRESVNSPSENGNGAN
jgi:sulfate adenylyltransferase